MLTKYERRVTVARAALKAYSNAVHYPIQFNACIHIRYSRKLSSFGAPTMLAHDVKQVDCKVVDNCSQNQRQQRMSNSMT